MPSFTTSPPHYLRTAANSRTHNRSQSLSLPIYIYIDPIYRDSYPRLCVALRNKHRQKLIMRPWSIIIRPLSSAASSLHITVHGADNKIPIVSVSSACKSISANRESFDSDTRLKQTEPVALFQKWNDNSSSLFSFLLFSLLFFSFFYFLFFFFFFEHAYVEGEKGLEKEKGGLNGWKVAETRASFDFSTLSFSRAISLASRWSNPSLDSHLDDRIEWTRTISGRLFARLGFNCSSRSFGLEVFDWISLLWIKGLCEVSGREIWASKMDLVVEFSLKI